MAIDFEELTRRVQRGRVKNDRRIEIDGQVYFGTDIAAEALSTRPEWVTELARRKVLPSVKIGKHLWFGAQDVENMSKDGLHNMVCLREAADIFHVSEPMLHKWVKEGCPSLKIGNRRLLDPAAVLRWVKGHQPQAE